MHIDHDHSHEHTHSHAHDHTHDHDHDHSHTHDHNHSHDQSGSHAASPKDLAILKYMLDHNKDHALELSETGARLADAGLTHAADMISDAVRYFDHANDSLEIAVSLVSGGK